METEASRVSGFSAGRSLARRRRSRRSRASDAACAARAADGRRHRSRCAGRSAHPRTRGPAGQADLCRQARRQAIGAAGRYQRAPDRARPDAAARAAPQGRRSLCVRARRRGSVGADARRHSIPDHPGHHVGIGGCRTGRHSRDHARYQPCCHPDGGQPRRRTARPSPSGRSWRGSGNRSSSTCRWRTCPTS